MSFPHHGDGSQKKLTPQMEEIMRRFDDQVNERAQRAYSQGRISSLDEGDLAMAIATDHKRKLIRIDFGKQVQWLAFGADDAVALAKQLLARAREISDKPIVLEL
jgi:hypothetical protein